MHSFPADCLRNGHSAVEPLEQIELPDLGEAGQHRVVTDDDHAMACRNSNERRASAKISSADWLGHTACLLSMACASQIEPRPSILLICSNESTSLEYASAAKLQEQHSRDSGILRLGRLPDHQVCPRSRSLAKRYAISHLPANPKNSIRHAGTFQHKLFEAY